MAGNRKKILLICLAVIIVLATILVLFLPKGKSKALPTADESMTKGDVHELSPNGKKAMENDSYILTLDEKSLAITLEDKKTGEVYSSVQDYTEGNDIWNSFCGSGITLEFYSGNSTVANRVSPAKEPADTVTQYFNDGFDADISYPDYGFSMQLQVRLNDDGVSVYVPGGSIKEGEEFQLGSLWLYPMFGSTYLGDEEGYMIIPEGVGAAIDLKDNHGKYKNPYAKRIFGENVGTDAPKTNVYWEPAVQEPEDIRMPVFGMVYSKRESAFIGIVTDGEYNAVLNAYPNGVITPYNWITAQFAVRDIYTRQTARNSGVPTFEPVGDIRSMGIRYIFTSGDEADYAGLANRYQQYLTENGMLQKCDDEFLIKLDFLGADSDKWFLFNKTVPVTSVKDMEEILDDLTESYTTDVLPTYFGFEKGGVTLNHGSTDTSIEPELGSERELKELSKKLKGQGIDLVLDQDLLLANSTKLYNTGSDIVKAVNQVIVKVPTYQKLFPEMYYMTPLRSGDVYDDFKGRYGSDELCSTEVSGITDTVFSYYSSGQKFTRADAAIQHREVISSGEGESVGMSDPNEYLWDMMDRYYDMPLYTSGYNFVSREIPFLPIVLRGYVPYWASYSNFEANKDEFFLKLLEYGAYPSFLVTSRAPVELRNTNSSYIYTSEYTVLKDRIKEYDEKIGEILKNVEGVGIEEHRYITDKVVYVRYKNGDEIYINYSSEPAEEGGFSIPALSYLYKEGAK